MAVALIASVPLVYDGHRIAKGAAFSARTFKDAHILKLIGKAIDAPIHRPRQATVVAEPAGSEDESAPRRRYRRRDLTADPA